ncbi:MAG: methionine aminotransferase, partial [Ferruginibacter sp.]
MKPVIHSKLPQTGTTIFTVMSALAVEHNAINLGQGFPDFPMSATLIDLVNQAMRQGHNQYVHMCGLPILRQRLSEKVQATYDTAIDPDTMITITPGGTYALYTAITTLVEPGDEVIVFEPAYDSYIPNIEINGGKAIRVPLQHPNYHIDWDRVRQSVTNRTKAIILNSPHNPTGRILSEDDIDQLRKLVQDTGIFIISDEVYEHLVFDELPHRSMLRYPDLLERSFVCFSFGKVYHCTGWKLGYCIAPNEYMKEFRKVHQFNSFTCNSPVQYALSEFINDRSAYLSLGSFLQHKRDFLQTALQHTPLKPLPSHGSYFQLYSYADCSTLNEQDMAIELTKNAGVTVIPVSAFYQEA